MASTIKGITVKLGGDTASLGKSISSVDDKCRTLQKELNLVNKALKFDTSNATLLAQKHDILKDKVAATREKLKALNDIQGDIEKAAKNGDLGAEEYRAFQREVETTKSILGKLESELKTTGEQFAEVQRKSGAVTFKTAEDKVEHFKGKFKDLRDAALEDMDKIAEGMNTAGEKIESVGEKLNVTSAAAAAVLASSIAAFKDLDEGYDTIVKKTGATGETLESLENTANEVFSGSSFDMTDICNAIGEVNTRFGYTDDKLRETTEYFLQFADINDTNVSDSVSGVSKIMSSWDVSAENMSDLLGLLTAKGQETGISVSTLMDKVQTNNATLKEMGLSLEESVELMAQFEKNGVNDTTALTAMKTALKNAVKEGQPLSDALSDTVGKIKNASSETEALQIATELFGTKGAAEMSKAIREGRVDFDKLSGSMNDYKDTVKNTYEATVDPIEESKQVINNLKLAGTELAKTALEEGQPLIEDVIDGVKNITAWLKKLTPEQKKTLTKAIEIIAVVGPGVTILGKVYKGIGNIVGILPKIASGIKTFGAALSANPVGAWTTAIVLATTAVAALAAGVKEYNNLKWSSTESAKFAEEVDKAADALEESANKIKETTKTAFDNIGDSIKNNSLIDTYQAELDELLGKQNLTDAEKSKLDLIVSYLTDNVSGFSEAWDQYTIRDTDGNIQLVDDLDTVRQALSDTIDEFQKSTYIELMNSTYSEELKNTLSGRMERDKSSSALENEQRQFAKRLGELGVDEEDFKKYYQRFGEGNLFNYKDIIVNTGLTIDDYTELAKMYTSISNYQSKVTELNNDLRDSDELQQDCLDVIQVLNGSYDDAAAVLMAYKLNMITLEDVTRNGWASIADLEKDAAETGKNTVFGVGYDLTETQKNVYGTADSLAKDFTSRLAISMDDTTDQVKQKAPNLKNAIGEAALGFLKTFIGKLNGGQTDVENAGKSLGGRAVSGTKNADAKGSGINFVTGFINGLKDNNILTSLWNTAKSVASTALDGIKSFLGIASPSKEAQKLGVYFGEGFSGGILKSQKKVAQASKILAASAQKGLGQVNLQNTYSSMQTLKSSPYFSGQSGKSVSNVTTNHNNPVINVSVSAQLNSDADVDALTDKIANRLGRKVLQDGRKWG